jgi:hypothetical protein
MPMKYTDYQFEYKGIRELHEKSNSGIETIRRVKIGKIAKTLDTLTYSMLAFEHAIRPLSLRCCFPGYECKIHLFDRTLFIFQPVMLLSRFLISRLCEDKQAFFLLMMSLIYQNISP